MNKYIFNTSYKFKLSTHFLMLAFQDFFAYRRLVAQNFIRSICWFCSVLIFEWKKIGRLEIKGHITLSVQIAMFWRQTKNFQIRHFIILQSVIVMGCQDQRLDTTNYREVTLGVEINLHKLMRTDATTGTGEDTTT